MNSTLVVQYASQAVNEFQSIEPFYLVNIADILCALVSAFYLRSFYKDSMKGVRLAVSTFLFCFGGSSVTAFMHGLRLGYLKQSTSLISYFIGLLLVAFLPQSFVMEITSTTAYEYFAYFVDALLRIHCVTSWGANVAIRTNGSVISATLASIATGCGGGFIARVLLDSEPGSIMDKIMRVYNRVKREIEHLLTMSLCYQIMIGFLPIGFEMNMDPIMASAITFVLFFVLAGVERITGLRLFIHLPAADMVTSPAPVEKEKEL